MYLALSILSAGVIASSLAPNKPKFVEGVDDLIDGTFNGIKNNNENSLNLKYLERKSLNEENGDDVLEDVDFDEDEFGGDDHKLLVGAGTVDSLMHIHHKEGEIMVPCFGMWWPVGGYYGGGGGGGGYEYIDYYGDYKKKRRRSRKQKKAAKMKKKKS